MRLDKFLTKCGLGTRTEVKSLIKAGRIKVNDEIVKVAKTNTENKIVKFDGKILEYKKFVYIMLNKPRGYVSATKDSNHETILDLINGYSHYDLHPVGRLDKDTEGLIILTNDGELTHKIISPKNHIPKTYYVKLKDILNEDSVDEFSEGIIIDNYKCMSAELNVLGDKECELTIYEGKFHQVKRMFSSLGNEVVYLKRLSINNLKLDKNLSLGEYRELMKDELDVLQKKEV